MRVLFSTTAGAGHFGPMIPVAHACAAAGHEVAVAAPASFASHVANAGLTHLPFPDVPADQMGAVFARLPSLPREEAERIIVAEVFGRLDAQAALPTLLDVVRGWQPDVVVRDPAEFGSLVAAAAADVPQAEVAIDLGGFMAGVADWVDEPVRELERMAGIAEPLGAERMLTVPSFSTVPASLDDSAAVRGPVVRFRVDGGTNGPALPAEWGDPGAPLVYVSFGSVAGSMGHLAGVYPGILTVLADLPVRVLITTGTGFDPAALGPRPDNAWVVAWWPQAAAMREASVTIGHGGFGTTMIAVAAGVPQLVLPLFSTDQFVNAEQVEAVGIGLQLLGGVDALPAVPALVRRLLDEPSYTEAARLVAGEMAALPDVTRTVAVLEDLASGAR